MALLMYNGTDFDKFLGTVAIGASNNSMTTTWSAGVALTAPNTSNRITGVWFYVNSAPGAGSNFEVEVRESGVSKVSAVVNNADIVPGFNYVRFTTPYQFTTTSAGAYIPYIRNGTLSSGSVARDSPTSASFLAVTYDDTTAVGATDDVIVQGFHDSGLTPKTLTLTGTSNSWGSGANKATSSNVSRVVGHAVTVGNGGTLKFDTTADCKLTLYGSVFATNGGVYDQRPGASSVSTLEFTNDADGDFNMATATGDYAGQLLTTGSTVAVAATYDGGVGTAADPATFTAAHGFAVGDELIVGWGGNYQQNEVRFVISVPSSTSVVWSATSGGAEAALTYTHTTGLPVANMTRNSIIKNTATSKGFSLYNTGADVDPCDFSYTRFEYPNCMSGRALQLSSAYTVTPIDGLVLYNNSAAGRGSISWGGAVEETCQDLILLNTRGSNFAAQSGFVLTGASGKTVRNLYHYAEPNSTNCCAAMSVNSGSTGNIIDGLWSSGANAGNGNGYAVGVYGSGNSFNELVIDAARRQAILLSSSQDNEFTNSDVGVAMDNDIQVKIDPGSFTTAVFLSCNFGTNTLLDGYLAALRGTDVGFQDMDGNTSKHRWYTNNASFWSAGAGLPDTTIRTAGSLSLAIKPEDATVGTRNFIVKVPANPTSRVMFFGYIYRNATFSSGDITVDLFLPGVLESDTPSDTVTLATTTGTWIPFLVAAYNPGTVARYAKVRITAKTATAGAYCFLDDIYDAGTGNKVAGLDLWDEGHISPIIVAYDYSTIPEQTRVAVWSDDDSYGAGEKGKTLADTEANTDVTQAKVDQL